jgi:hypothetical protein
MTSVINNVYNVTSALDRKINHAAIEVKKGVFYVGETAGNCMYDVYDLTYDGFDKLTKAAISNFKLITLVAPVGTLFKSVITTLEAQKDLIYATKFIGSITHFIGHRNKQNADGRNIHDGHGDVVQETYFKWPTLIQGLYAVANFLELGKFLQKYNLVEFKEISRLANEVGSYQVSFLGKRFDEIPLIGNVCNSPKDIFVFAASTIENYTLISKIFSVVRKAESGQHLQVLVNQLTLETMLKFAGSTGKMILITCARTSSKTKWFVVVDAITQNASLLKYFIDRAKGRAARFEHPRTAPAA